MTVLPVAMWARQSAGDPDDEGLAAVRERDPAHADARDPQLDPVAVPVLEPGLQPLRISDVETDQIGRDAYRRPGL